MQELKIGDEIKLVKEVLFDDVSYITYDEETDYIIGTEVYTVEIKKIEKVKKTLE